MIDPSLYKIRFIPQKDAILWLVGFTFVGCLIVFLNLATILAFVTNRTLQRRSVYCLINLAIADLLYGIVGIIYGFCVFGFVSFYIDVDPTFSTLVFVSTACTLWASVLSLATVSLERFFAFFLPFRHRVASQRMYISVFVVSWVISIIAGSFFIVLSYQTGLTINYVLMTLSLVIIFSSYFAIFIKVKKHNPQEIHTQPSFSQRRQIQEKKLAKTFCIVTVLSVMTWVPYIAYRLSYLHFDQDELLMTRPNNSSLMMFFQRINSVVNPIVYFFRMRDFRKTVYQLLCRSSTRDISVNVYPVEHRNEINS